MCSSLVLIVFFNIQDRFPSLFITIMAQANYAHNESLHPKGGTEVFYKNRYIHIFLESIKSRLKLGFCQGINIVCVTSSTPNTLF